MGIKADQYGYTPIPLTIKNDDGSESITRHFYTNGKGERIPVFEKDVPKAALETADSQTESPAEEAAE